MTCADIPILPVVNAQLLEVRARSTGDSYRGAAADGPQRWSGEVGVWVEDGAEQRSSKGDVSQAEPSFMAIEVLGDVSLELGDTVTYRRDRDGVEVSRRVQGIDRADAVGLIQVTFWET